MQVTTITKAVGMTLKVGDFQFERFDTTLTATLGENENLQEAGEKLNRLAFDQVIADKEEIESLLTLDNLTMKISKK